MYEVLRDLLELLRVIGTDELRVVGGVAMRLLTGESSRVTRDIDVVAFSETARDRLLSHLVQAGYRVAESRGWYRAILPDATRAMVDIARHPVVNPRTFETITLREPPALCKVEDVSVPVAAPDDLALLKFAAHRDQDIVDLLLLASDISPDAIAAAAANDDIERTIAEGAQSARYLLATGGLDSLTEELIGHPPQVDQRIKFERLLGELQRRGL